MEAKDLHGRHFTLQEFLPSKNARVFSLLLDIVATIWLSPASCLPLLFLLLFHNLSSNQTPLNPLSHKLLRSLK